MLQLECQVPELFERSSKCLLEVLQESTCYACTQPFASVRGGEGRRKKYTNFVKRRMKERRGGVGGGIYRAFGE